MTKRKNKTKQKKIKEQRKKKKNIYIYKLLFMIRGMLSAYSLYVVLFVGGSRIEDLLSDNSGSLP